LCFNVQTTSPLKPAGTVTVKTPRSRSRSRPTTVPALAPGARAAAVAGDTAGVAPPRPPPPPPPSARSGPKTRNVVGCRPSYSFGVMKLSGPSGISIVSLFKLE
jgi:hypothetical protein